MRVSYPNQAGDDAWLFIAADETLPPAGGLLVTIGRWRRDSALLVARPSGRVGVQLDGADDVGTIAADLGRLALVVLTIFPAGDGRGYSQARLLRERHGYSGELRAVGALLTDHLLFLMRCGIDHVVLPIATDPATVVDALSTYSVTFQPAGDSSQSVLNRRRLDALRAESAGYRRGIEEV